MIDAVETDYLIVGGGAMGLAFADTLLSETAATVAIVDRHARPGGHWNDAYPFVRLHQPSAFYGVNSQPLGDGRIDAVGWNVGLHELASASEVLAYYDHLMYRDFLPSGRVRYLPMSDWTGDGVVSMTTGAQVNCSGASAPTNTRMKAAKAAALVAAAMKPVTGVGAPW